MYRLVITRRTESCDGFFLQIATFYKSSVKQCINIVLQTKDVESFNISWKRSCSNGKKD